MPKKKTKKKGEKKHQKFLGPRNKLLDIIFANNTTREKRASYIIIIIIIIIDGTRRAAAAERERELHRPDVGRGWNVVGVRRVPEPKRMRDRKI